jgi:NAD(P)-dependent dehydrogenase (short-subunit alcohol dehydrogenase family)
MSAPRFAGKVAIVTGAGSGIGRATAIRLLDEGAQVIATDLMPERLAELGRDVGTDALVTVTGDISSEDVVQQVVAAAGSRIDILVNNAGIMDGFLPAGEVDDATWQRVFDVNVTSVMRLTRAVLPAMVAARSGTIVNVASEAGLRGGCAGAAYTASKAAVIGFTKNTAFMYQPDGIRVNAVAPGATATNIEAPFKSERGGGRLGPVLGAIVPPPATAEQLAAAITWLASDDSANVTGAVLASDGGWSAI